jgi:squalene-hopene/tetraprenyl-beta-curcumene cyclase
LADVERDALDRALNAATGGLLAAQDRRGCWMDFPQVGEGSDEWITGYVGTAIAGLGTAEAIAAAARGWKALASRPRWSGGWGFMPSYPADADSTICALRLAQTLPAERSLRAWRARVFLRRHQGADGGISTYRWPAQMVWSTGLRETFAGWCSAHVCVSANATHLTRLPGRRRLLDFLRSRQLADGAWRSYWWYDEREYATALAAEALALSFEPADVDAVRRAVAWARDAARSSPVVTTVAAPCGSAFATALRLRVLLLGAPDPHLRALQDAATDWLLSTQREDGRWAGSAWLRFPPTDVVDTTTIADWRIGEMVRAGVMSDGHGLFTTATVLTALQAARRAHTTR